MALPYGTTGSLNPTFVSARYIYLAVKHPLYLCARRLIADQAEGTFGLLRYSFGGDRPSQTARLKLSSVRITEFRVRTTAYPGWYFKVGSTETGVPASTPPTYPTQDMPQPNISLQ